jgi:hypothetical protein
VSPNNWQLSIGISLLFAWITAAEFGEGTGMGLALAFKAWRKMERFCISGSRRRGTIWLWLNRAGISGGILS